MSNEPNIEPNIEILALLGVQNLPGFCARGHAGTTNRINRERWKRVARKVWDLCVTSDNRHNTLQVRLTAQHNALKCFEWACQKVGAQIPSSWVDTDNAATTEQE